MIRTSLVISVQTSMPFYRKVSVVALKNNSLHPVHQRNDVCLICEIILYCLEANLHNNFVSVK